jgi:DNA-binding response OmpR family regulator
MPVNEGTFQNRTAPNLYDGAGKRILVIDDDQDMLDLLQSELGKYGYEVVVASNGEDGLSYISRSNFDLAFCDWKMPGMNGQEVFKRIGAIKPELRQRLVILTGDLLSNRTYLFIQMQKLPYLVKPFSLPELHSIIKTVLNSKPGSDLSSTSGDTARWRV